MKEDANDNIQVNVPVDQYASNLWSLKNINRTTSNNSSTTTSRRSEALQEFGNPPLPQCLSEMNPPLNFTTMSAMVTAVVGKDSTDHCFVQYVYDLKPNKQQIRSIRNIWKAIYNKKAC
ncbi:unnamed protein product [Rotaria sp. Silwood1]|nr:unnamed protein product [Rotaria sp. Silwood1]CAF1637480.1 unnamed protein product [Rotaria sp. Silwood1]